MRRTIITLDTKDGKYIPVLVVMEELCPDMQDYGAPPINKRPNSYDKDKNNLSFTIEEFTGDDPFELNGNCGRLEQLGEYVVEPGNDCNMLLTTIGNSQNTLTDVLPKRQCPMMVSCLIDKERAVWSIVASEDRLLKQLKYLSERFLGFDLTLYPEHVGNIYYVRYNPYLKKLSFKASKNPAGLIGKVVYREGKRIPLRIIVKDKGNGGTGTCSATIGVG